MKLSKKGMLSVLLLAILFNVIMGTLFIRINGKQQQFAGSIGETSVSLLETYEQGAKIQFYMDQASGYAVDHALDDFGKSGLSFEKRCGEHKGYTLWQSEEKSLEECVPSLLAGLGPFIDKHLNVYLGDNVYGVEIPKNNYDYLVAEDGKKTVVYGSATLPIEISILCGNQKKECGTYEGLASFSHPIGSLAEDYSTIKSWLAEISEGCAGEQDLRGGDGLQACVGGFMGSANSLDWSQVSVQGRDAVEDRHVAFSITSDQPLAFAEDVLKYELALFVPDAAAPPAVAGLSVDAAGETQVTVQWQVSAAFDVVAYDLFSAGNPQGIDCRTLLLGQGVRQHLRVEQLQNGNGVVTFGMGLLKNEAVCFAVIAVDEVGNQLPLKDELVVPILFEP